MITGDACLWKFNRTCMLILAAALVGIGVPASSSAESSEVTGREATTHKASATPAMETRCLWRHAWWSPADVQKLGPRDNADPSPSTLPVDLVVVGQFKAIGRGKDEKCTLQIEKTIYGSAPRNPLPVDSGCGDRERYVVHLAPDAYRDSYLVEWLYQDLSEVPAEVAYWAAVMDCEVLSYPHIFVGEEVSPDGGHLHTIKVTRSLHGSPLQPGQQLTVHMGNDHDALAPDLQPVVRKGAMIYLATDVAGKADKQLDHRKHGPTFEVKRRLKEALEPAVLKALGRRELHPVVAGESRRSPTKVIDIIFSGTTSEAIDLLGSSLPETVALVASTLIHNKDAAQPEVVAAIERDLLRMKRIDARTLARLCNLIKLLRYFGQGAPAGEAGRLVDKLLREIPDQPFARLDRRFGINAEDEAQRADANHALTWLLLTMKKTDWDPYLPKLLRLRAMTKGHWKGEVQLALDATKIEDKVELARALSKQKATALKRIPASSSCGKEANALAFVAPGKQLITVGTNHEACLWDLATMTLERYFSLPDRCQVVSAREDGRYLVCYDEAMWKVIDMESYDDKEQMINATVVDINDGKVVTTTVLPACSRTNAFRWIDDHRALVATENRVRLFDYLTGKVVCDARHEMEGVPSEDGAALYNIDCRGKDSCALEVHRVDTRTGQARKIGEGDVYNSSPGLTGLVPGGRFLYLTAPVVGIYDRKSLAPVAAKDIGNEVKSIVFSSDGALYALTTEACQPRNDFTRVLEASKGAEPTPECPATPTNLLRIHETMSGDLRAALQVPEAWTRTMIFSPDAKQLALLAQDGRVRVWTIPER